MGEPLISVIVPVYRARDWVGACLASLVTQTLDPAKFEVLLILNGPEEGSREVIAAVAAGHPDHRIEVLTASRASAGAARNVGLQAAVGEYVCFVDADDWVSRDYLELLGQAANPGRIPLARIVDVEPGGMQRESTNLNSAVTAVKTRLVEPRLVPAAMTLNACKLLPRAWFQDVRYREDLVSGEDLVMICELLSGFERSGVVLDRAPFLAGATYFRRLTANSVSRRPAGFDFNVTQRLAVIEALSGEPETQPWDRPRLAGRFIRSQIAFIAGYLAEEPERAPEVSRAISELGLRGVAMRDVLAHGRISLYDRARTVTPPRGGILVAAADAGAINERRSQIEALRSLGIRVQLIHFSGGLSRALEGTDAHQISVEGPKVNVKRLRRRFQGSPSRKVAYVSTRVAFEARHAGRQASQAAYRRLAYRGRTGRLIAERDALAGTKVRRAGLAFGVDQGGFDIVARLGATIPPGRIANLASGSLDRYTLLIAATRPTTSAAIADEVASVATAVSECGLDGPGSDVPLGAEAWALIAWNCFRAKYFNQALRVLDAACAIYPGERVSAGLEIWRRAAEVNLAHAPFTLSEEVISDALTAADASLASDDVERALFLLEGACEVVFAASSNSSGPDALLFAQPDRVLAPLMRSRVWQLATAPQREERPSVSSPPPRPGVVVSPGAYGQFVAPVVRALRDGGAEVRIHDLGSLDNRFRWLGVDPRGLRERFEESLGIGFGPRRSAVDPFLTAGIVLCDWADQAAVLASRYCGQDTRVVVRMHGIDAVSMWAHLVDWSRVDDVVFVSEHHQSLVACQLGERLAGVRQHVLPNIVELDRFSDQKDGAAERTLAMVGWAQVVKDPLWALEVLAILRGVDPTWRLILFGDDFADFQREDEQSLARAFRRRALCDDVRDGLRFEGFVRDLPERLRGVGFALSTSQRESQGVGLLEMIASGAVPVVRDWPMYRRYGGARAMFPEDWVVDTPEEAAARILATSANRAVHGQEARAHVLMKTDPGALATRYRQLLLGETTN